METPNIEPTNVETPNTETSNAVNPNMKTCKHCGHIVAKNAKTCPSCGGKLKKNLGCLIGCSVSVGILLILILVLFTMCSINQKPAETQTASFNTNVTTGDFEINVDRDILTATQLNGDNDQYKEFLTTDMTNYGNDVLCDVTLVAKDGYTLAVVDYTIKNIGQDSIKYDDEVTLDYNNGYTYDVAEHYWTIGDNDSWHLFTSVDINPLTTLQCKAEFYVPTEVFDNKTAPLKLTVANCEYTIR